MEREEKNALVYNKHKEMTKKRKVSAFVCSSMKYTKKRSNNAVYIKTKMTRQTHTQNINQ